MCTFYFVSFCSLFPVPSSILVSLRQSTREMVCANCYLIYILFYPFPRNYINDLRIHSFQGLTTDNSYNVVPIHHHPELINQCIQLINSEWPRSRAARLWSLESSRDRLPTCLVLTKNCHQIVIAHAKLSPVPFDKEICFIESVVVSKEYRGQGYGKLIMNEAENYCRDILHLKTIYLSTIGQEQFYQKLGYEMCQPISMFGSKSYKNSVTNKTYMKKCLHYD